MATFFDCATVTRGVTYNKSQEANTYNEDFIEILRANNITLYTNSLNFDDVKRISKKVKVKPEQWLYKGDILICAGSGSKEHIGKVTFIKEDMNYSFGGFMSVIRAKKCIDSKYLYYCMVSNKFKEYLATALNSTTINNLNIQVLSGYQIPLPSLSEQQRIVDILDKFEGMVENVEKELLLRQKQYEVYRKKIILSTPIFRRVLKLSEMAKIKNGKDYKHLSNGNIPVWGTGGIMTYVDTCAYNKPSVLLPRKGSIKNIYYTEKPFWTVDTLFYTEIDESVVVPKYFFYYMSIIDLSSYNTSVGNRPSLTKTVLDNIEISLPYLDKQQEIVAKLDKFEEMISTLKRELELRKKQYEYYREKLLTFE